nr:hypothetical protein [Tanacetum cinerariifolium]
GVGAGKAGVVAQRVIGGAVEASLLVAYVLDVAGDETVLADGDGHATVGPEGRPDFVGVLVGAGSGIGL